MSATYTTAHGNTGSLTHWARPGIERSSSGIRTAEPRQELPCPVLKHSMSFKCLVNAVSPFIPFIFTWLLRHPGHLHRRIARRLGLAKCILAAQFTQLSVLWVFCKLATKSRGFIRLRSDLCGKSVGNGVLFYHGQMMPGSRCCVDARYLGLVIGVVKWWHAITEICLILSFYKEARHTLHCWVTQGHSSFQKKQSKCLSQSFYLSGYQDN